MNSRDIADDNGHRLRANYFPFQVDRSPPPSAGFQLSRHHSATDLTNHNATLPSKKTFSSSSSSRYNKSLAPLPSTYMIVDYNQDTQRLHEVAQRHGEPFSAYTSHEPPTRQRLAIQPVRTSKPVPHPSVLRSSFVMQKKFDASSPELQNCLSQQLFNKQDASCQTERSLFRHDFKGLTDYNDWSNHTVEPFLKELRKVVRANRPVDLPAYISAYCAAIQSGHAPPATIDEEAKDSY